MPKKIRIGPLIFFIFSAAVFMLMWCSYRMMTESLPVVRGRLILPGLEQEVHVFRDGTGVPHVFAKNENDLFFAQGFVTAQDRLWQIDFNRHAAQGRLSEWFGPRASCTDSLLRRSDIRFPAARGWSGLPGKARLAVERYAAGVNAFIGLNKNKLPVEYKMLSRTPEPWQPEDVASLFKFMCWQKDFSWLEHPLWTELFAAVGPVRWKALPAPEPMPGSSYDAKTREDAAEWNAFLRRVFAEKWISPPVSGDMAWVVPPPQSATGKPVLSVILRSAPANPSPWYEIRLSSPSYRSRGLSLPGFPFILAGHNGRTAWAWTPDGNVIMHEPPIQNAGVDDISALYHMGSADAFGFFPSVHAFRGKCICADTSGRVMSFHSDSRREDFRVGRLHTLLDPVKICSVEDVKKMQADVFSDAAAEMVMQIRSILGEDTSGSPLERQARALLFQWNGDMQPGSAGAALFETLALECTDRIFRDEMGDSLFASFKKLPSLHARFLANVFGDPLSPWWDDVRTAGAAETAAEVLKTGLKTSSEKLAALWGDDMAKWSWAGLHTLTFHHPLDSAPLAGMLFRHGPYAVGGSATTLFSSDVDAASPFKAAACVSAKMVLDLADWDNSASVQPPGQGGQIMDMHQQDQIEPYLQNQYHFMVWDSLKMRQTGTDMLELLPGDARGPR